VLLASILAMGEGGRWGRWGEARVWEEVGGSQTELRSMESLLHEGGMRRVGVGRLG
jgi:hypothetical protein